MSFADRLKAAILASGQKQRQIAERAGTSQQVISAILKRKSPRSTYTAQLAKACGVSPEWLATGEGTMYGKPLLEAAENLTPAAEEVARAWMKLSPTLQASTRVMIFHMASAQSVARWLSVEPPPNDGYADWEAAIQASYDAEIRQLRLDSK